MHIILIKNSSIGKAGKVLKVKSGYAINFLIPKKLALPISPKDEYKIEYVKRVIDKEKELALQDSKALSAFLKNIELSISARTTAKGKLFGSITSKEISKLLGKRGYTVSPKLISTNSIKSTGKHIVSIKLHDDQIISLKLTVVSKDV